VNSELPRRTYRAETLKTSIVPSRVAMMALFGFTVFCSAFLLFQVQLVNSKIHSSLVRWHTCCFYDLHVVFPGVPLARLLLRLPHRWLVKPSHPGYRSFAADSDCDCCHCIPPIYVGIAASAGSKLETNR